jgi:membrane-bound ClpP family serine protease
MISGMKTNVVVTALGYLLTVGVAGCPLRPGGLVVVDGTEYPAHSDPGYIDRGARVIVTGKKGTSLLVRPAGWASFSQQGPGEA